MIKETLIVISMSKGEQKNQLCNLLERLDKFEIVPPIFFLET